MAAALTTSPSRQTAACAPEQEGTCQAASSVSLFSDLASPPLVVAYALAGSMDVDLYNDPLGQDEDGNDAGDPIQGLQLFLCASERQRDSSVMMSSVMPSLKYSWLASPLMLVKGRTAIEGFDPSTVLPRMTPPGE